MVNRDATLKFSTVVLCVIIQSYDLDSNYAYTSKYVGVLQHLLDPCFLRLCVVYLDDNLEEVIFFLVDTYCT